MPPYIEQVPYNEFLLELSSSEGSDSLELVP